MDGKRIPAVHSPCTYFYYVELQFRIILHSELIICRGENMYNESELETFDVNQHKIVKADYETTHTLLQSAGSEMKKKNCHGKSTQELRKLFFVESFLFLSIFRCTS